LSKADRVRGGALAVVAIAALALPASADAITDTITAESNVSYSGNSDPNGFLLDAGQTPGFVDADPDTTTGHNVVATEDGPDGQELFKTPLLYGGGTADVEGAQYLSPGSYPFVCTIHAGMAGTLIVSGDGAVPRPAIDVAVVSTDLKKAQRGKLKVRVSATTLSDDASVQAKLAGHFVGSADGIDLAAGQSRTLTLKLDKVTKKNIADLTKAKVSVTAAVPYGAPASDKAMLKD
jgi:plastocyanin